MINNYLLFYKRAFIIETKEVVAWTGARPPCGAACGTAASRRRPPPNTWPGPGRGRQGNTGALLGLLYRQRKAAMEALHGAQRRVDILDYMIRSLREPERRQ